jgi:hypothetical protein
MDTMICLYIHIYKYVIYIYIYIGVVGKLLIDQALFSPVFTASIVTIRFVTY